MLLIFHKCMRFLFIQNYGGHGRVAKVGSHSARAKMATKIFVRRLFGIFATDASFLHAIAILQI